MNKTTAIIFLGLIMSALSSQTARGQESDMKIFKLWSGAEIPSNAEGVPVVRGIEHRTIHDARQSDYKFLHGAAMPSNYSIPRG